MRMYVPTIGFKFKLTQAWSFVLYRESRNDSLLKFLHLGDAWEGSYSESRKKGTAVAYGEAQCTHTFPAGTTLTVDRIYIRKGVGEYDSITFNVNDIPDIKKKGRIRFWAKLDDVNQIQFESAS